MFSVLLSAVVLAGSPSLEPSSQWVVDFAEQQCVASRMYRDGAGELTLAFRQSPYDDVTHMFVVRPGKASKWADQVPALLSLGGAAPDKTFLLRYGTGKGDQARRVSRATILADKRAQLASAQSVSVSAEDGTRSSFRLTKMSAISKLLNDCTHDLRKFWNMGEAQVAVAVPAKLAAEIHTLFSYTDYPAEALRKMQQGSAQLMLLISDTGAIESCQVVHTEGAPVFETMGCQVLMERAKFKPALDLRGKPIRSSYLSPPIRFRLR